MYSKKPFKNSVVMFTKVHENRAEKSRYNKRYKSEVQRYNKRGWKKIRQNNERYCCDAVGTQENT